LAIDDTKRLFLGQLATGAISLLSTIVIARYVGAESFGFCTSLVLLTSVVLDLIDFGTCSWAARGLASGKLSTFQYLSIMRFKVRLSLLPVLFIPLFILIGIGSSKMAFLFLFYPALWLQTNYIQQFLIAKSKVNKAILLQVVERCFWLLYLPASYFGLNETLSFIFPILLGLIAHGYLGRIELLRMFGMESGEERVVAFSVAHGYSVTKNFGLTAVVSDLGNLDGFVIAKVASLAESGTYNLAMRFRNPMQMSFQAFATKLRPIAARGNRDEIANLFRTNLTFNFAGIFSILLLSTLAYFAAEDLFGETYAGLNAILALGVASAIPCGIGVISSNFLNSIGQDSFVSKMSITQALTSLCGVALTAKYFGGSGAMLFIFTLVTISSLALTVKSIKIFKRL
jgi:O-antigen/teichoic acid export membrane protein